MLSSPPRPAWLLGGPDEGVIDGLDNEVEMQGILHQVLGVAPLQVGVRQEVTGLLAALVEAVGVADQQAAVVARPHQHGLLEAHARRVAAAAGRRDHQPGPAVLGACEGQRCTRGYISYTFIFISKNHLYSYICNFSSWNSNIRKGSTKIIFFF